MTLERYDPTARALFAVTVVLCGVGTPLPGSARPRTLQVAQLSVDQASPPRIENRTIGTPRIERTEPGPQRIEPRPADDAPRIVAPPLGAAPLAHQEASGGVPAALQRLIRQAEAPRNFGSTPRSAQAAWQLGLIYLHGAGVRRDSGLAQTWFERAARFGREPWAQAGLAWCHIEGCQGPPDPQRASEAIERLRARHPARADYLQWVLATRTTPLQVRPPGIDTTDPITLPRMDLLQRAASAGDPNARVELGLNDIANQRVNAALEQFRLAGPNSRAAQANIRLIEERKTALVQPTSPQSNAAAILAQARQYHRGAGRPANYTEAIRLYRLAESKGSVEAHKMLELIFSRRGPGGAFDPGWMQQLAYVDAASAIPTVAPPNAGTVLFYRDPTPLYDQLPDFWRGQLTQIGR